MEAKREIIAEKAKGIQELLGEKRELINPDRVISYERHDYQSDDFRRAGFNLEPGREDQSDRHLHITSFEDGRTLFVISGKQRPTGPYQLTWQGPDLRPERTIVYEHDGKNTITGYDLSTGDTHTVTGEHADVNRFLNATRQRLGKLIKKEVYSEDAET